MELRYLFCAHRLIMLYIWAKFWEKISKVSELETQTVGSMLGWSHFTKGHNSVKTVDGVMVLNLCTSSDDVLYLYQVSRKYLKGFQSYWEYAVCILKFSEGYNSVNSVGGVMVLVLSTLSDSVLYLYQVLSKFCQSISKGFKVTDLNSWIDASVVTIYKGA